MNKMLRYAATASLLALVGGSLRAAEANTGAFQVTAGLIAGTGDHMKAMKDGAGYTLGLAYNTPLSGPNSLRLHANALSFDGKPGTGLTDARPHFFGGIDLYSQFNSRVAVYGGVIAMRWNQQDASLVTAPEFKNRYDSAGTQVSSSLAGTKLGGRVGLEVLLVDKLSARVDWTFSQANLAYKPSWVTVGVTYTF